MATKKAVKDTEAEGKASKTAKKTATAKSETKKTAAKKAVKTEEPEVVPQPDVQTKVIETHAKEQQVDASVELSIAQKLLSLYNLQQILSQIDRIHVIRGELPEEIRDLEDAHEGMQTRINKFNDEIATLKNKIVEEETKIKEATAAIKRYEEQQNNVRNNREYESLSKEVEYQKLEIQVSEKHKAKHQAEIQVKSEDIVGFKEKQKEYEEILVQKKAELEGIIADTEKEEAELRAQAEVLKAKVDARLLTYFEAIRSKAHNGLAIVQIDRDACGGCFSTIPPQHQLDIRLHKKIIVCETCRRIFIDRQLVESQNPQQQEEE